MRPAAVLALLLLLLPSLAAAADGCDGDPFPEEARTDHQPTGNRVVWSCAPMTGSTRDLALAAPVSWVLPDPIAPGASWIVFEQDGTYRRISGEGDEPLGGLVLAAPPVAFRLGDGTLVVRADGEGRWSFDDPLPDARAVRPHGFAVVALVGPTERYPHGVLGDDLEASAAEIVGDGGDRVRIEIEPDAVIEGISPLLADLTGDGQAEILVTVSDAVSGARLRLYDQAGALVAESEPIGKGFRWMHQIGAGSLGPNGETEIIAVRTPHIGGIVEAYRLVEDRLERVATQAGYSSHSIGSRNLDTALLADADADGRLDVVVPTQDMTALGVLARVDDGFSVIDTLPLDGRLVSNVAAAVDVEGRLYLAAATADGRLRVFR